MSETLWPVALLVLRISVAVMLYLFLAVAFRALYAELRPARAVEREATPEADRAAATAAPAAALAGEVDDVGLDDDADDTDDVELDDDDDDADDADDVLEHPPAAAAAAAAARPASGGMARSPAYPRSAPARLRPAIVVPVAAAAAIVVLGAAALAATGGPGSPGGAVARSQSNGTPGPPVSTPAAGRVSVGLSAVEDSNVRVTVDGVVQFDAVLRAGQARLWEGGQRIQVWTDKGKTLEIAINGQALGPYSPAMGHPDWNRIDFGFWPGWPG